MKTFTTTIALVILTITSFSQNICPSSFKRNNGNGTCNSLGELRLSFSPSCPVNMPIIDSVYIGGIKNNVSFAAPDNAHCGSSNGYLSYCVTSGNMPPANVWTIFFHVNGGGKYSCTVESSNSNTLSVKYHSFDATINDNSVTCKWITEEEINNDRFELERSFDGTNFSMVAMVFGVEENKGIQQTYKYTDKSSLLVNKYVVYYRLRQIDNDGKFTYSNVLAVRMRSNNSNTLVSYPNPVSNYLKLTVNAVENGNAEIRLTSLTGQTVASKQTTVNKGWNNLQIENLNSLSTGLYVAQVLINGTIIGTQKIIKN